MPNLVGVLGTKLPAVLEYSWMLTTSPICNGIEIVSVGASVLTVYSKSRSNKVVTGV
jgi:hypothetical protein